VAEVPRLDRLDVHHADDLVACDDRNGEHRGESFLVDLGYPLPAGIGANIASRQRDARVRDPADDPFADSQRRPPDTAAVEPVGRHEPQHSVGPLEEIQR
jgi:hypothetical protein